MCLRTSRQSSINVTRRSVFGIRTAREMRTLAEAIDSLLEGDSMRTADLLIQQFKAVETSVSDGSWSVARHLEWISEVGVGLASPAERDLIAKLELHRARLAEGGGTRSEYGVGSGTSFWTNVDARAVSPSAPKVSPATSVVERRDVTVPLTPQGHVGEATTRRAGAARPVPNRRKRRTAAWRSKLKEKEGVDDNHHRLPGLEELEPATAKIVLRSGPGKS